MQKRVYQIHRCLNSVLTGFGGVKYDQYIVDISLVKNDFTCL
jgi:hypothetical protein